jgi:hypothetical protein
VGSKLGQLLALLLLIPLLEVLFRFVVAERNGHNHWCPLRGTYRLALDA